MSDVVAPPAPQRLQWAVALLVVGVAVAFVPGLIAGDEFLVSRLIPWSEFQPDAIEWVPTATTGFSTGSRQPRPITCISMQIDPSSLMGLATTDAAWAISLVTLVVAPAVFVWWRRSAIGFGRLAGAGCCVAAAAATCVLVLTRPDRPFVQDGWTWRTVPLGALVMAAAFVVAPAPRRRDE